MRKPRVRKYLFIYVGTDINDPGGIPKYVENTAGFIYSYAILDVK